MRIHTVIQDEQKKEESILKKIITIGLFTALILAVTLVLSLSVFAAGTPANTVNVGSTTLNASNTSMTAGSGTVTFDAAKGILTLNNATGIGAITGANGDLTVIANGTNTMSVSGGFTTTNDKGSVTFGGTGSLSMKTNNFGVYVAGGRLTVTDSIRLTVESGATNFCFGTQNVNDIVFEKNCVVTLTGQGDKVLFHNKSATHKIVVKDNANVTVNAPKCSAYAIYCSDMEISGGALTVNVTGLANSSKVQGIFIEGNGSTMPAFSGGKLTVNMNSANSNQDAVHAFYLHKVKKADFCGTDVTLNVTTPKAGGFASAILTGWSKEISISGGTFTANLNGNTTGLIAPRLGKADFVLNITGGTLTGSVPSLLNTSIGADASHADVTTSVAVNVGANAKVFLTTAGSIFSSAKQYSVVTSGSTATFASGYGFDSTAGLVTENMAGYLRSITVWDSNGTQVTLNKENPSMTAGNGTITYDPETATVTVNNATAQKIFSAAGDLKILVKGNNLLSGTQNFLINVEKGDLTIAGDGKLEVKNSGLAVYVNGGNLTATDDVTLIVSGKNLVYGTKNSDATDGNVIFSGNAKVTINATAYQAIFQNMANPVNPDQHMLVEGNAKVEVNLPNASSGAAGTYTTAILVRGLKMTGGELTLNHTGAENASSRALGIQVEGNGATKSLVELLGGKLTVNHVSKNPGQSLAYSLYTYKSNGIVFGGTDVTFNLSAANGGNTSGLICPAVTPYVKITGGTVKVNANDKAVAFITPRLANSTGKFLFEMTGGTLTGKVPSLLNTNNDGFGDLIVTIKNGAKINLNTPLGALSAHKGVKVNTSATDATFLEGCNVDYGNQYLITSDLFQPGDILSGIVIKDAKGTTTLNYGKRDYYGTSGRICLDPEARTLLFDGVLGPVEISIPDDVEITLTGTNIIKGAMKVQGTLTLVGSGSLELTGEEKLLTATAVEVKDCTLRIWASGNAVETALTVSGTGKVRILSDNGTALNASSVSVKDSALLQVWSDGGNGLIADAIALSGNAALTVDAVKTGITLNGDAALSGNAVLTVYSDADGICLAAAELKVQDTAKVIVSVSGKGIYTTGNGSVTVTGGSVAATGAPAIMKDLSVESPYLKGGEAEWKAYLLDEIRGTEKYMLLSAQNPGGSPAPADYSKVDEAIAAANALNKDHFKDFSAVTKAINAVVPGKLLAEQDAVDAMAKAINDALAALEYKDADYSAVEKAIADANALNKDDYKDFSSVTAAINAVVSGKKINEQAAVDAMAKAINDAVASLQPKTSDNDNPGTADLALTVEVAFLVLSAGVAMILFRKRRIG